MNKCIKCGHRYWFHSGTPGVCLICVNNGTLEKIQQHLDEVLRSKACPDQLFDKVTKHPLVLEAERIIRERSLK